MAVARFSLRPSKWLKSWSALIACANSGIVHGLTHWRAHLARSGTQESRLGSMRSILGLELARVVSQRCFVETTVDEMSLLRGCCDDPVLRAIKQKRTSGQKLPCWLDCGIPILSSSWACVLTLLHW